MRRILSIICIIFLIGITSAVPYYSSSYFVYADDGLSDQQKTALAMSSYFNYRKGWFVGSAAGAVGVMKSYIDEFFNDSANNTGINSYTEFVSHVDVEKNSSGNWGVTIDNTGLVFLDHLCKWLLGKNKFPNLYSGGAWGQLDSTNDPAYQGYISNGCLYYQVDITGNTIRDKSIVLADLNDVTLGNPVRGLTPNISFNSFLDQNHATSGDFLDTNSNVSFTDKSVSIDYFSDKVFNTTIKRNNSNYSVQYSADLVPFLMVQSSSYIALNISSVQSADANSYMGVLGFCIYANRVTVARGNPAYIIYTDNGVSHLYNGFVCIDHTHNLVAFRNVSSISVSSSGVDNSSISLNTSNFDKNDVGQADQNGDPVQDAASKTFTPEYTSDQGDTYNYYTNETVNNFYNEYINNYTYNTNNEYNNTVINNNTTPGDSDDPEEPVGGTVPDWSGGGGSGTITPDGNGGYTFELPDFSLPDLNIDWKISGLTEKFPFSIPFDLYALFTVLNAEPETPEIHGEIPIWTYTWEIDWDLHQFDSIAALMRNLEFIAFCIGLAIITRNIIRG